MPYQQPLVPPVIHVADPVDLPLRAFGENGLCQVTAARVLRRRRDGFELTVSASTGETLFAEVVAVGEGVIRVRLAPGRDTRGRSAPVATLVRQGTCDEARIEEFDGGLRLSASEMVAEIVLDPWQLRFLDSTGRLLTEQHVEVTNPLTQIPLFVRLASVIPMADGGPAGPTFVQWGDGAASARLLDEHGETTVEVHRRDGTVVVRSDGPVRVDRLAFPLVAGTAAPTHVVVDGERFSVAAGTATAVREAR